MFALSVVVLAGAASFWSQIADEGKAPIYVSLGDAIGAGSGASDPASTSFASIVAARQGAMLLNFAAFGATTRQVVETQLRQLKIAADDGDLALVTVVIGGSELRALLSASACVPQTTVGCPLEETLGTIEQDVTDILERVRQADRHVPIVVLTHPNPFSGTGHPLEALNDELVLGLNQRLRSAVARHERVAVADIRREFQDRAVELTHITGQPADPHPNDAGHRVIADVVLETLQAINQ